MILIYEIIDIIKEQEHKLEGMISFGWLIRDKVFMMLISTQKRPYTIEKKTVG